MFFPFPANANTMEEHAQLAVSRTMGRFKRTFFSHANGESKGKKEGMIPSDDGASMRLHETKPAQERVGSVHPYASGRTDRKHVPNYNPHE